MNTRVNTTHSPGPRVAGATSAPGGQTSSRAKVRVADELVRLPVDVLTFAESARKLGDVEAPSDDNYFSPLTNASDSSLEAAIANNYYAGTPLSVTVGEAGETAAVNALVRVFARALELKQPMELGDIQTVADRLKREDAPLLLRLIKAHNALSPCQPLPFSEARYHEKGHEWSTPRVKKALFKEIGDRTLDEAFARADSQGAVKLVRWVAQLVKCDDSGDVAKLIIDDFDAVAEKLGETNLAHVLRLLECFGVPASEVTLGGRRVSRCQAQRQPIDPAHVLLAKKPLSEFRPSVGAQLASLSVPCDALTALEKFPGLEPGKKFVGEVVKQQAVNQMRAAAGLPAQAAPRIVAFTGDTGTGKSLIAAHLAEALHQLDRVSTLKVTEVDLANELDEEQLGRRVVVIRNLAAIIEPARRGEQSLSESARELTSLIEQNPETWFVLSGSASEVTQLLAQSPRLAGHVRERVEFPPLSEAVLAEMIAAEVERLSYRVADDACAMLAAEALRMRAGAASFQNGKEVAGFVADAIRRLDARLWESTEPFTPEALITLTASDFVGKTTGAVTRKLTAREKLKRMHGMQPVVDLLDGIIGSHRAQTERVEPGAETPPMSLNFALLGPPGVGKTVVARLIYDLLVEEKHLLADRWREVDRSSLIGQWQGDAETFARNVWADTAQGGLFIDEVATAVKGKTRGSGDMASGGFEAFMKLMEDERGSRVTIWAGYDLHALSQVNEGIMSRLKVIRMPIPDVQTLVKIAEDNAAERLLKLGKGVTAVIAEILEERKESAGDDFGYARAARDLIEQAMLVHGARMQRDYYAKGKKAGDAGKELSVDDIREAAKIFNQGVTSDAVVRVTSTEYDGAVRVPVTVSGERVEMVLDSGASFCVVDEEVARRAKLRDSGRTQEISTAGGIIDARIMLGDIDFGPFALKDVFFAVTKRNDGTAFLLGRTASRQLRQVWNGDEVELRPLSNATR